MTSLEVVDQNKTNKKNSQHDQIVWSFVGLIWEILDDSSRYNSEKENIKIYLIFFSFFLARERIYGTIQAMQVDFFVKIYL